MALDNKDSSVPLVYTQLSAPDRIRLLRIAAPTSDLSIVVSFEEAGLQDKVEYHCLSYTWDGPKYRDEGEHWTTNHKRIVCNGMVAHIRQNLHDALLQLRDLDMLGPIWIDALCINQEDVLERNSQVGHMGEIYKGATQVIVWLGKEDEHTKIALTSLGRSKFDVDEWIKDNSLGLREYLRCSFSDEELHSIHCFTGERRWFSRLWIVQETVLARHTSFLCGAHGVQVETICTAVVFLRYGTFPPHYDDILKLGVLHSKKFLEALRYSYSRLRAIGWVIHTFRESKSTDPR